MVRRRIFGGELTELDPDFDWMPDSRHICLSDKGNLSLADTRTGNIQQITASPIGRADHPSVSPDGKRVVFTTGVADYDIVEVPLDGKSLCRSNVRSQWKGGPGSEVFPSSRYLLLAPPSQKGSPKSLR